MKITITQRNILRGRPRKARKCPIALAVHSLPFVWCFALDVLVSNGSLVILWLWGSRVYPLPLKASCFIADFDGGRIVQPFAFEI